MNTNTLLDTITLLDDRNLRLNKAKVNYWKIAVLDEEVSTIKADFLSHSTNEWERLKTFNEQTLNILKLNLFKTIILI